MALTLTFLAPSEKREMNGKEVSKLDLDFFDFYVFLKDCL